MTFCRQPQIELLAVCDKNLVGQECPVVGEIRDFGEVIQEVKRGEFQIIVSCRNGYQEIVEDIISYAPDMCPEDMLDVHEFIKKTLILFETIAPSTYYEYLEQHQAQLKTLYESLADELSIQTLDAVLKGRLRLNDKYVQGLYDKKQYFVKDIVKLGEDEVFVDAGAYVGDSLFDFTNEVDNKYKKVYSFEPSHVNYEKLCDLRSRLPGNERIELFENGVSDSRKKVYFKVAGDGSDYVCNEGEVLLDGCESIELVSLDEIVGESVTFIKMDIEGSELEALKGATRIIKAYKPKLAICIYHKATDIISIPEYIMSLGLDYKYYIRHHADTLLETVFYAIPC